MRADGGTTKRNIRPKSDKTATLSPESAAEAELPDSVELYLNEIARFKLLTPQEEIDLFKKIEHGRTLAQLGDLYTAETGMPPTLEELTYLLIRDMARGLQLVRDSAAIRGFPPSDGLAEELRSAKLREAIASAIDPRLERKLQQFARQGKNRVYDAVISLSGGLRIFGPEPPPELERALRLVQAGATPRNQKLMAQLKALTPIVRRARE